MPSVLVGFKLSFRCASDFAGWPTQWRSPYSVCSDQLCIVTGTSHGTSRHWRRPWYSLAWCWARHSGDNWAIAMAESRHWRFAVFFCFFMVCLVRWRPVSDGCCCCAVLWDSPLDVYRSRRLMRIFVFWCWTYWWLWYLGSRCMRNSCQQNRERSVSFYLM